MVKTFEKRTFDFIDSGYINWAPIITMFEDLQDVINENARDTTALAKRQTLNYRYPIWAAGDFDMLRGNKHPNLKIVDGWVITGDNSDLDQTIEIVGISDSLYIPDSYKSGVVIPLEIINEDISFFEDVIIRANTNKRMIVELLCESNE